MHLIYHFARKLTWEREDGQRMPASILAAAGVSEVTPEQHPEPPAWEPLEDLCWRQPHDSTPEWGRQDASFDAQQGEIIRSCPSPSLHNEQPAPDSQSARGPGYNDTRSFQDSMPSSLAYSHPAIPNGLPQPHPGQEGLSSEAESGAFTLFVQPGSDPATDLTSQQCQAVAAAALSIAAIVDAPAGLLEFLLDIPWTEFATLYVKSSSLPSVIPSLIVHEGQRRQLVNTPIHPVLLDLVAGFLAKPAYRSSLPVMAVDSHDVTLDESAAFQEMLGAVLDGATPLHCAALRTSPKLTEHLLASGADPMARTAAGDLPMDLVPACKPVSVRAKGARAGLCGCSGQADVDGRPAVCQAQAVRAMLARRALLTFSGGFARWLVLLISTILTLLGLRTSIPLLDRPTVVQHQAKRADSKRAGARSRAQVLLDRMRGQAQVGRDRLALLQQRCLHHSRHSRACSRSRRWGAPRMCHDPGINDGLEPPEEDGLCSCPACLTALQEARQASTCFSDAIRALQELDLRGGILPRGFADASMAHDVLGSQPSQWVLEDEQANIYCCWAESIFLKARCCSCRACATLATQAAAAGMEKDGEGGFGRNGHTYLTRPSEPGTAAALEAALAQCPSASRHLTQLLQGLAQQAAAEVAAGQDLQAAMSSKGTGPGAMDSLQLAIQCAAGFVHLQEEVAQARQVHERWGKRAQVADALDGVIDDISELTLLRQPVPTSPAELQDAFWDEWTAQGTRLEEVMDQGRSGGISISRAKRLLKELQAQAAAGGLAQRLHSLLQECPVGSSSLKSMLAKAEAAASAKAVSDLPRLEAAILAARKVGAHEADTDAYRQASEARAALDSATHARQALEAALKLLQRGEDAGPEEAAAVEAAIHEAQAQGTLLAEDVERGNEVLLKWRQAAASKAKLENTLASKCLPAQLARAIQEAAASGVRVTDAKRNLKLLQGLESAIKAGEGEAANVVQLRAKLDAALQAGVSSPLIEAAREQLQEALLGEVRGTLEAALKPSLKRGSSQRSTALKSALARAEILLQDFTGGEPAETEKVPDLAAQGDLDLGLDDLETSSTDATSRVGSSATAEGASSETSGSSDHQPRRQQGRFATAVSQVLRMVGQARKQLEADSEERQKAEQQAAEEQRQRKERQKLDKEKRLAELKEKTSKAKLEKERSDRQKAERREADRAERLQAQWRSQEERKRAQAPWRSTGFGQGSMSPGGLPDTFSSQYSASPPISLARPSASSDDTTPDQSSQISRLSSSGWGNVFRPLTDTTPGEMVPGNLLEDWEMRQLAEREQQEMAHLERELLRPELPLNMAMLEMLNGGEPMLEARSSREDLSERPSWDGLAETHGEASSEMADAATGVMTGVDSSEPSRAALSRGPLSSSVRSSTASIDMDGLLLAGSHQEGSTPAAPDVAKKGSHSRLCRGDGTASEPDRRPRSPDMPERSASSSGTNTPRLRFADLGGAAWGREAPAAYTSLPPTALHQSLELQRTGFPKQVTATSFHPAPPLLRPPSSPLGSMGSSSFPQGFPQNSETSIWGMPAGRTPTLQVYPSIHGGSLWADAERSHSGPQAGELAPPGVDWADTQPASPFARPGSAPGSHSKRVRVNPISCTGQSHSLQSPSMPTARTLHVQRPCRYYLHGFCRDGDDCRRRSTCPPG
ncbi:hypothetical protein WJX84_000508 [Apatococcus fuscideae]|uniref:C3H1-type domain-containing protein n=1 Tax=Apatococcus fuscideae TaxID=2026836 RepID=A0AAW1T4V3_9CHLO